MTAETNYFWLNCGYNRWNHNEPLVGQTALFRFNEQLKPLTADYLKRSEALEFRMSNMKETLFNQITAEEFDLISGLGKGEIKIPRYFFLAETEEFEPGNQYTIYTHTYNGIKRNGYHFYTQLEEGDNIIFYNRKNQSVVGIGEVSKHIHEKPPIPGRTNSTVIEVSYEKDITPITLSTLNKHPKLKNLYFLQENAKQAIASMSQAQYDAIIEMSDNNGLKSPFEMVQKPDMLESEKEEALKPFILLVVDRKEEGLKAANDLLQKANANPVITTGHPDFSEDMLYGKYLPNETGALYYREGFITQLMPKKDKSYLVIDNFNRIDTDIFQTYINVLEGYEVTLPRYNKDGNMIKWSRQKDSFYYFNPNWHIVGITYDSLEEIKEKYSEQFLKYTRIVKVKHD